MKKSILVLIAVVLLLVLIPAGLAQAKEPLQCTIEYWFVGEPEGDKFLTWQGTIGGDIEGTINWYAESEMRFAGQTSHYFGSWEIKQDGVLILAGIGSGSTTVRHGNNSIWRTNDIVTFAGPGFEEWLDRRVHEGGTFEWADIAIGLPSHGSGFFRVN